MRRAITEVLKFNKENPDLFTSNENLCSFVLCDSNSMLFINQKWEDCKDFPKLAQYNAEFFASLKYSDTKKKNGADCTDHKVKCLQYEKRCYKEKGVYSTRINRITKNTFKRFP